MKAVESFERGLRLEPNTGWFADLGSALLGLNRPVEAEAKIREILRLQLRIRAKAAGGSLATFFLDQNRPAEAEVELRESTATEPRERLGACTARTSPHR